MYLRGSDQVSVCVCVFVPGVNANVRSSVEVVVNRANFRVRFDSAPE